MRERRASIGRDDGFTLIELMVVLVVLGVLAAIAVPTFLDARTRADDKAAQSDLRNGALAARTIYSTAGDFSAITIAEMRTAEPALQFVLRSIVSSPLNDYAVSFRVWNFGEVNMARLSASGDCYYIRAIEEQGFVPADEPGTYYGWRNGIACTGDQIAGFGTTPLSFPGW
jgi:type IV pilus assembly protein PilA